MRVPSRCGGFGRRRLADRRLILDARDTLLPNGLRVVTASMPQSQSVAIGFWIGAGGRSESEAHSGISHFIEHLAFKGTRTRSAREISEAVEGRGGDINAYTQEESTCYYARLPAEAAWMGLDVLADLILHARFAAGDVDKEREVVIEEIMMYRDQPQHRVEEMLSEQLWSGHALGRPLTGTVESVRRLGRGEVLRYRDRMYAPGNIVAAFAGNVRHEECVRRVRRLFPERGLRKRQSFAAVDSAVPQVGLQIQAKEIEQAHMAMGFRIPGRHDPRRYALKMLSVLLGENMSSRLFQVVREDHGLAYAIQSGVHLFADSGAFVVSAGLDCGRVPEAMKLIVRELARMRRKGVTRPELDRARDYAIGQIRLGLEGSTSQMTWIGEHFMGYGRHVSPEEAIDALASVTPAQVRAVAERYVSERRLSVAMIIPKARRSMPAVIRALMGRL